MFASLADDIMRDFHILADKMAWLSSAYYLSNVVFLLIAGVVLDKYSVKKTLLLAMFLCVLSTFWFAQAQSFTVALICRLVTGAGSAFCFLGAVRMAARWFPARRMAMVTGLIVTFALSGGWLAQYPLAHLTAIMGWRNALMIIGWLGVALFGIMCVGIIEKPADPQALNLSGVRLTDLLRKVCFNGITLRAGLYTSLMNMAIAVLGAMMGTLYIMERLAVSKQQAALVNSMLFLGVMLGGPVVGWISDKLRLRLLPMRCGAIGGLLTVMAMLYLPVSLTAMKVLFFLLGFFTASQVISYAFVAERNAPWVTATALSVVSILTQGGYVVYQNLFAYLLSARSAPQGMHAISGYLLADYQWAVLLLPAGLLAALLVLFRLTDASDHPVTG